MREDFACSRTRGSWCRGATTVKKMSEQATKLLPTVAAIFAPAPVNHRKMACQRVKRNLYHESGPQLHTALLSLRFARFLMLTPFLLHHSFASPHPLSDLQTERRAQPRTAPAVTKSADQFVGAHRVREVLCGNLDLGVCFSKLETLLFERYYRLSFAGLHSPSQKSCRKERSQISDHRPGTTLVLFLRMPLPLAIPARPFLRPRTLKGLITSFIC
jgi:hypothetical protein